MKNNKKPINIVCLLAGLLCQVPALAGFLEMPEITEVPELERKSMLRDLDIPSVRDRDPDPEAGPRLAVSQFRLQGIVEYPELGITRKEISKLVEDIRFDMMAEEKLLESGYTLQELGELSDLIVEIEEETVDRHVGPLEVQKLVWLVREQRSKRGITLGMIETVADKITNYYRERGFILAKAYIPEQQVRDGVVTLTLLLGVLGGVEVNENRVYSDKSLSSVFKGSLAKPVTNKIVEEKLYFINDFPGITVQGFFEPGAQVGDTKLNINVTSEKRYDANLRLDNHGSEQTGENRSYAEFLWNNPAGNADQLQLGALYSASPSNTTYGLLRYSTKLFSPRFRLAASAANNEFVIGPGNSESINFLQLEGETKQTGITASYAMKRSRTANYSFDFVSENIESIIRTGLFPEGNVLGLDDEVRDTSLVFNYDILQESIRVLHQGSAKLTSGEFLLGQEPGQDKDYTIFSTDYTLLTFWNPPLVDINTRVIVRASAQFAGSALSSINQFSLAGPTRARGFSISQFSADDAAHIGVDWIFSSPGFLSWKIGKSNFKDIISPFIFADISHGEARALAVDDEDSTATLANLGVGIQFSYLNKIRGNLQFAFPITEDFSSEDIEAPDDSVRVVFDLQYSFR